MQIRLNFCKNNNKIKKIIVVMKDKKGLKGIKSRINTSIV